LGPSERGQSCLCSDRRIMCRANPYAFTDTGADSHANASALPYSESVTKPGANANSTANTHAESHANPRHLSAFGQHSFSRNGCQSLAKRISVGNDSG
jgi:hypothetical protein